METHSHQPLFGKFDSILLKYDRIRDLSLKLEGSLDSFLQSKQVIENRICFLDIEETDLSLCVEALKSLIDLEITKDIESIRDLQIEGLREVFYDQDLSVRSEISDLRGKISVQLDTVSKCGEVEVVGNVVESFGGSLAVIQGILFRISVIFRRNLRPILLLDETLRFVSDKYAERAVDFLQAVSEKLGLDILLITHDEEVVSAASRVYRITYDEGKASFRKIK
jgi:hypothetical protein